MTPERDRQHPLDLESALRAWGLERERSLTAHPNVDQLDRYSQKRLDRDEREVIEEHLTYCSECATLLLELPELLGEQEANLPHPAALRPPRRFFLASWLSRPSVALRAVAVSLVVSVVAVAWALLEVARAGPDRMIRFAGPIVEIFADGARRETVTRVELPPIGEPLLFSFRLPSVEDPWPTEATAILFGSDDRVLYRVPSVRLDHVNSLELSLGAHALPPGAYRVELLADGQSPSRILARFRFELVKR